MGSKRKHKHKVIKGNKKLKGHSGLVKKYMTRNAAVKKLQLSLRDFRKLCILKGIYPREPKNRKKVQRGNTEIKTLYYTKDIQFLMHEPIIWKFREHKSAILKIRKAYAKNEKEKGGSLFSQRPVYHLHHIIKERYPTFTDALQDIDDPLTLCTLFSKLSRMPHLKYGMINASRRVLTEFMLYVIEARALRKVFISIKGYYYQAEILGQTVTWIAPHPFTPKNSTHVDIGIMKTFLEFYLSLMSFVNFRLYGTLNLHYPPMLPFHGKSKKKKQKVEKNEEEESDDDDEEEVSEADRIASLNVKLFRNKVEENDQETSIDMHLLAEENQQLQDWQEEEEKKKKQQNLFTGSKFFLNRETNIESLTFVIRSCGGEVSWDKVTACGGRYQESDETITHQVVDRPDYKQTYMSRYYVQPQWVYDCVNARLLLPIQDYFPGAKLPPHLSPFDIETELYVPPEKKQLLARQRGELPEEQLQNPEEESDSEEDSKPIEMPNRFSRKKSLARKRRKQRALKRAMAEAEAENRDDMEIDEGSIKRSKDDDRKEDGVTVNGNSKEMDTTSANDGENSGKDSETKPVKERKKKEKEPTIMEVTKGKTTRERRQVAEQRAREEHRLNVMMIPRKRKRIYNMLLRKEKQQERKAATLTYRRAVYDAKQKMAQQEQKKKQQQTDMAKIN